jgi:Matrixin
MPWLALFGKKLQDRHGSRSNARRARPCLEDLESRVVLYTASGNAWPAPQLITISFMPDGTSVAGQSSNLMSKFNSAFGSTSTWENLILQAAQLWAQKTNINFAVVPDNGSPDGSGNYQQGDPGFGDIRIGGYNFNSTALAGASMPPPVNNFSIAGDIFFNTAQPFKNGTTYDLETVAAHEIGHALGLYHSGIASAVMYATYNGVKHSLTSDDTAGIQSVYGGARQQDQYYGSSGNGSISTAYNINSMITSTQTALVTGADITTAGQQDYYSLTIPSGTNGTMQVNMQSSGLSLLEPKLSIYNASGVLVASASGSAYGATITATLSGVTGGQTYYVDASSPLTTANGTGAYALSMTFGTSAAPTVPLPNTQLPNGNPLSCGGGLAVDFNSETLVNTTTTGVQTESPYNGHTVAIDANGNYVVVWQSQNQDGSGWGIYAQRYSASGAEVGGEFRVNTTTTGDQEYPSVAMSPGGNFVVVWASANQDGSGWGVFGQQYSSLGVAIGGEFRVNTYTTGDQSYPDIAMDQNGDFVVTWASSGEDGSGWGVYAQRYSASGAPIGGEFRVNTTTTGDQTYPSVSMDSAGDFVIAWQSQNQDGSGWGVYAQRYNASGSKVGGEFLVNTVTGGDQTSPSVAMDGTGDFTIAWDSLSPGGGPVVDAQRYNSLGATVGGQFQVNTLVEANLTHPSVATDQSGDLLFTWSSYTNPATAQWNVMGRQFNASGVALGPEFQVNTSVGYNQMYANAAMNNQGQVVVDWAGGSTADSAGIYMQQYTISFVGLDSPAGDTFYAKGSRAEGHSRPVHHPIQHKHRDRATRSTDHHHLAHQPLHRHAKSSTGQVVEAAIQTKHPWSRAASRFHFSGRGVRSGGLAGSSAGGSSGTLPLA